MKILVTGGTGFIGAHLSNFCLNKENTVHICDNNIRGTKDEFVDNMIHRGAKFIKCDLTKKQDLDKLDDDYDVIFHFAAINGTENFYNIPYMVMTVGISSTMNLLEKYGGKDVKFIFSSSSETYASTFKFRSDLVPTPETIELCIGDIFNPRFSYGGSKITCELLISNYANQYGLDFQIIRYNNVYGPRMGFKHVIPQFIKRAYYKENPFVIYGSSQTRAFCYVEDAARVTYDLAMSKSTGIFHIGNDSEEMEIIRLAEKIVKIFDYSPKFKIEEPPKGSVQRRCPDVSLIREITNFNPQYGITRGLEETVRWYSNFYSNNLKSAVSESKLL